MKIHIAIDPFHANLAAAKCLTYGVMAWGTFGITGYPQACLGVAAIIGGHGLFVSFILQVDKSLEQGIVL